MKKTALHFEEESRLIPSSAEAGTEAAAAAGAAMARTVNAPIMVSHSEGSGACALAHAFASGVSSAGVKCIAAGECTEPAAAYAAGFLGCGAGCCISTDVTMSMRMFMGDGLPLYRSIEEKIEQELTNPRSVPFSHYGKVMSFSEADSLYAAKLRGYASKLPRDMRIDFYSPSERLTSLLNGIFAGRQGNDGNRLAFHISSDGRKTSAYSEETGYVFSDKLMLLCCRDIFNEGQDTAVCGAVPKALEEMADSMGRSVISCGSGVCINASKPSDACLNARRLASAQMFMNDGAMLMLKVLGILARRNITLREALSELPRFAVISRYIPIRDCSELLERLCTTGGTAEDSVRGKVTIRPVRTGKGIMLNVESYAMETASELCDLYEEKINRHRSGAQS